MTFRFLSTLVLVLLSFSTACASPLRARDSITTQQILSIAPTSSTCAGADYPAQCRTADQVAPLISQVFDAYDIVSPGEKAAVLTTIAFETTDFKYNINITPGIPGQGTRNMQSAAFNLLYAQAIPELAPLIGAASSSPNGVRDLLTGNDLYDFGSAAWFLINQCSEAIRAGLQSQGLAGWEAYVSGCVGSPPTEDRQAYWQRAAQALGAIA